MNTLSLELLISIIIFLISIGLGLIIFLKNRRSATNKLFFVLSLLIDVYIIINYLSLHPPAQTVENQLFWIRMVMVITSFIGPVTLLLAHTFPSEKIVLRLRYIVLLGALTIVSATVSATSLVFQSLEYINHMPIPIAGPAIPIFFLDFVGVFLISFGVLINRYQHKAGEEKIIYLLLLLGVIISFSMTSLFTIVFVVIFKTSRFVLFGPLSPVILLGFITYAIVKHALFNIRVIAAEVFTVIISLILFSKIFVNDSMGEVFVDVFIFLTVIIFGVLLIRSVQREVTQRQKMQNLATEVSVANKELEALDQTKSEFMSIASHQLRTPLTIIHGYLSLALEGDLGKLPKLAEEKLSRASTSTVQLIKLVNELLNFSRMEAGKIEYSFAVNDFNKIIKDVIVELHAQADAKKLMFHLRLDPLPPFIFDCEKMHEAIINFVHNAVKYTSNGEIEVRSQVIKKDAGSMVRFSVKDHGIGITQDDISRLFNKFIRTDSARKSDPTGLGLGLYFVKKVTEGHGGHVWAESEGVGKGSTFILELPIKTSVPT